MVIEREDVVEERGNAGRVRRAVRPVGMLRVPREGRQEKRRYLQQDRLSCDPQGDSRWRRKGDARRI